MKFDHIYLVANLAEYDFENVVLLADDVDSIVTELLHAADGDHERYSRVECCEKLLFLGRILTTALQASRRVVKNFDTLQELLRVNWSQPGCARKWDFVRDESESGVVNRVARGILSGKDGERCLGVVKAFYKRFSSKDEFRKVIGDVQKGLAWRKAAGDFLSLMDAGDLEGSSRLEILEKLDSVRCDDPRDIVCNTAKMNLRTAVEIADYCPNESRSLNKVLAGILVNIQTGREQFLDAQIKSIRSLTKDKKFLEKYQNLMEFHPFYEANLELLRVHHRKLQEMELLYDSNTILLCHLIYGKSQNGQFLRDFLNEQNLGGPDNLELILAELQNFTG